MKRFIVTLVGAVLLFAGAVPAQHTRRHSHRARSTSARSTRSGRSHGGHHASHGRSHGGN